MRQPSNELRDLWRLALPMIGTQLLWMSMPFIDNVMVGQLGREPLAALAICGTYYTFFLVIAIGILSALNPIIAQLYGAGDYEKIGPYVQSGLFTAFLYSLFTLLGLQLSERILLHLGQDPSLIALGKDYLTAVSWGIPAQMLFLVFRQYSEAIGFPGPVIIMVGVASFANIFLDYALIHGWGPFPKFGIAGAGHATAFLNWVLVIGLFLFTRTHPRFKPFAVWSKLSIRVSHIREILWLGSPLAGGILMEVGYFCGSTWLAGSLGALETAAHQIALNVASITFMIPLGLGFAVSVLVGQHTGAKKFSAVRQTGKLGFITAFVLALLSAAILFIFAKQIARLYTIDAPTQTLAISLLGIAGFFQVFDALQCVGVHALRGIKDTRIPFLFSFFAYWVVGISLSLTLGLFFKLGINGVWYGMIVSLAIAAGLLLTRFERLTRIS